MSDELPTFTHIKYERDGDAIFVIFNRPEKLNAVNQTMHNELVPAITCAEKDPDSKVIIFTGAGRGFCAGGDVAGQASSPTGTNHPRGPYEVATRGENIMEVLLSIEKPTIAMVNGPAVGLGASIALLADMAVVAEDAVIGDSHVKVGLVPGDGGAVIWPLLIGPSRAKEMLMTGRLLSGREAEGLGLVNHAVPPALLRDRTLELAAELTRQPTYAVRATKYAINRHIRWAMHNAMDVAMALEFISMAQPDHHVAAEEFVRSRAARDSDPTPARTEMRQ